jgi:Cu(I)/Ag(I) efflux system periplasmic protein CusF
MMKVILSFGLAAVLALGASACGGSDEAGNGSTTATSESGATTGSDTGAPATNDATPDASASAGEVKEYTFHGTVKKIDTERQMITIDHEKIGDYMDAMTMPFKVADPALLDQVKVGDETHFTLRVAGDQALITKVQAEHDAGSEH